MKLLLVKNKLLPFLLVLIGSLLGYYILYSGNERPNKFNKTNRKLFVQYKLVN